MKLKYLIILTILFFKNDINAQLGINVNYDQSNFDSWQEVLKEVDLGDFEIYKRGYGASLDYGFSMKHYRVDFYPEITFRRAVFNNYQRVGLHTDATLLQYGLNIRMQVYPLDLLSKQGMQCPSFRRGDIFSKGLYFSVKPGVFYSSKQLEMNADIGTPVQAEDAGFIFGFGLGTGLDIGISELISITPNLSYNFYLKEEWEGFSATYGQSSFNDKTAYSGISAGIRLGMWF
jgi:hypothetical protein